MKYSEYKWLSEHIGSWEVRDIEDKWDDGIEYYDEYCEKLERRWKIEEECMDTFFLHECDGECKKCALQKEYINDFICSEDCGEYILNQYEIPDCNWCPIGLRIGIKQIEPEETKRKRIELEKSKPLPKYFFKDYLNSAYMIDNVECTYYHYLESINYFSKEATP